MSDFMEILKTIMSALEAVMPYWPFITQVMVIWLVGQVAKKRIWTKKRAEQGGIWLIARSTLPLHPIVAGALWGALWPFMPSISFIVSRGGAINAGMLAGAITMIGHTALESLAKAHEWTPVLRVLQDTVPDRESSYPPPKE